MNEIKTITAEQLLEKINKKYNFKLVDVLLPSSYKKWHIPSSINIQLDEIEKKAQKFLDLNDEIIVYCSSSECQASSKAARKLKELGYKDVKDYEGGKREWDEKNFPKEY
ncbi:MAG: rhodanese-like domain-containing protein [Actinomycetota bacterium]|jgi:rhodanese-related sulfurtransferase|nr:rhodanese-like domain-containing protein [Actinomycetota bacterium]